MEKVSSARISLKWGLISALFSILYTTLSYVFGFWQNWGIGFLVSLTLYFSVLVLAMKEFKSLNGGFMKFSEGLSIGTLLTATSAILGLAFDFIYKKFIDPDLQNIQLEMAREQYEKFGMSEEQIEQSLTKAAEYNNSGLSFIFGVLTFIFIGFICSLIVSAILKKEKSIFD